MEESLWGLDALGIVLVEEQPWRVGGYTFVVDRRFNGVDSRGKAWGDLHSR